MFVISRGADFFGTAFPRVPRYLPFFKLSKRPRSRSQKGIVPWRPRPRLALLLQETRPGRCAPAVPAHRSDLPQTCKGAAAAGGTPRRLGRHRRFLKALGLRREPGKPLRCASARRSPRLPEPLDGSAPSRASRGDEFAILGSRLGWLGPGPLPPGKAPQDSRPSRPLRRLPAFRPRPALPRSRGLLFPGGAPPPSPRRAPAKQSPFERARRRKNREEGSRPATAAGSSPVAALLLCGRGFPKASPSLFLFKS